VPAESQGYSAVMQLAGANARSTIGPSCLSARRAAVDKSLGRGVPSGPSNTRRKPFVPDTESTSDLIQLAQSGDAAALDRLIQRQIPSLRRWATGRLPRWARDLSDTQDLVQDTTLRVLGRLRDFRPQHEGALKAYLRQAILNEIRDQIRRAERRPHVEELHDDMPSALTSPLDDAIGLEAVERYEAALASLDEDDRAAVVSRIELGTPYGELAVTLGKASPDAARMAVQRALVRLATRMSGQ
jgi:RNA polymerase sigma factor (sigma-70 family)